MHAHLHNQSTNRVGHAGTVNVDSGEHLARRSVPPSCNYLYPMLGSGSKTMIYLALSSDSCAG